MESKPGDRGNLARASGNYVTVIIAHITDENMTRVKVVSTLARSVADANTSIASLPDQAAMASQHKTLQQECAQLKKHLQEVIAERDKAVA